MVKRGFRGKYIGACSYIHRSIYELNPIVIDSQILQIYNNLKDLIDEDNYEIVKVDVFNESISLITTDGFNQWLNPVIVKNVTIFPSIGNEHKITSIDYSNKLNKQIYHRKNEFVTPDYDGFDIILCVEWQKLYENSGILNLIDKSKIGYIQTWKRGLTELKVKFPVEFEKFESYCDNILK